ncbi:hydrogenase maturation nickel metallochaperone HypA [Cellulosilyticum sp. I15G10I2]|uniref:hydrogenase maturation nickel metallochaperone HypA n=1 Tax=Cellulosilyticum sp. I15G10I2 TaxID=1892843 RepID=UPI00085C88C5|nr:hydrogenase maturation nickel metallochaperone HypA [Cellulosilyticum sp. I15G10I2]
MHEVSIVYNILEIAKEYAANNAMSRIKKIIINVGEFCALQEDSLDFAFEALSKGSLCEGSQLITEKTEAKAYCRNCAKEFNITFTNKLCPVCKTFSYQITTGYELLVTKIEGE